MHMEWIKIYYIKKNRLNVTILWNNTKTFRFDYITKEDIKEHNPNWAEIPDHPYRILIICGSGSGKTNSLLNLINNEPDIDKFIYMLKIHTNQNINY